MNRGRVAGIGLFGVGVVGYAVGLYAPYTGRAFSLTVIMTGLALATIGSPSATEGER
ncbi:MAG: hypothetical protein ACOC0Z_03095 [Halohasta sp.]